MDRIEISLKSKAPLVGPDYFVKGVSLVTTK